MSLSCQKEKESCILQNTSENSVAKTMNWIGTYINTISQSLSFFVYSTPPKQLEYLFTECVFIFQTEYENLEWESGHSKVERMFSIDCMEARISQHGDSILLCQFTMSVSHQQNSKLKPKWHNFLLHLYQKVLASQITTSANTKLCV